MDSTKSDVTFSSVVCDGKCNGQFSYTAISSHREDTIISQLVCTSVSFDLLGFTQTQKPVF